MGVQGLLPKLKSITQKVHISQLKGQRIAVDAYCLLHKGAYTCARELVEGIPTDKCVAFCMGRIAMLMREELVPYVVFDGGPLPNKKEEEDARALSRRENREKARLLWNQGSKTAAMEYYQKAVDITPDIAYCLIEVRVTARVRLKTGICDHTNHTKRKGMITPMCEYISEYFCIVYKLENVKYVFV